MNRHYIDNGMGEKIDVTTIDGKPFITSADKARAIGMRDTIEAERKREQEQTKLFIPYAHDMQVNRNKDYGELVLNIILIAVIIAGLVIAYNLGFH